MLPSQRNTSRCIYCAFRAQQRALQARRLRSSVASKHLKPNGGPTFTYYRTIDREGTGERNNLIGKVSDDGRIRKLLSSRLGEWGLRDSQESTGRNSGAEKDNFNDALYKRMDELRDELEDAPVLEHLRKEAEDDGEKQAAFKKIWKDFRRSLHVNSQSEDPWTAATNDGANKRVRSELREAYSMRGVKGLDERIKYAFYGHVTGSRFTESDIRNQKALADLRYPAEWFPATRRIHRTVHLHVGPTNSGKTYHALQRLEKAEKGVYAGPLRLLAHEVYSRMNAKGRPCALITGEERRSPSNTMVAGDPDLKACTVEMMPLNNQLDVAVIDEIQMIGNNERGWAWTQALMGVKAKEVHLCGEERTVPLIRELCASVGDKLEIHRYERLSPLKLADESLNGDLSKLRKGDCIVSFSVMGIHALRKQIERQTGRKVATVYGSLPPETRAQQARLFNDHDNDYDFLVASDAVGMGLNLAIKRIIFEASAKYDGVARRTLSVADIKQIAGRAGRYRTAQFNASAPAEQQDLAAAKGDSPLKVLPEIPTENVGLVTTLEPFDFPIVSAAMSAEPEPIRTAGLFPPSSVLERFASYFPPGTPFSYILIRLHELSQMHSRFHLCGLKEQIWIADLIEPVKGLTASDRNVICSAPASKSEEMWRTLMPKYARCIAEQSGGSIIDIEELPLEILEVEVSASKEYLRALERLHKGIVTYLWLSYRFAGIFTTRALAFHVKGMVEEKIEDVLGKFSFRETQRRKQAAKREKEVLREMERVAAADGGMEGEGEEGEDGGEVAEQHETEEEGTEASAEAAVKEVEGDDSSLIAGGDRFGGEEDIAMEDPADAELAEEDKPAALNFAQWRQQQTRGESQATKEPEDESAILAAFDEGEREAASVMEAEDLEQLSEKRPSVADADPEAAATMPTDVASGVATPEQDTAGLEVPVTPETEPNGGERPAVLRSQVVPPKAIESPVIGEEVQVKRAGTVSPLSGNLLSEHSKQIEADVAQSERHADSRLESWGVVHMR